MKTAKQLIDEKREILSCHHKGATVTLSDKAIEELMEEYHEQFETKNDIKDTNDCRGFSAGYKDDYGFWHTYDNYCVCSQCLRFNPEVEKPLITFIGWDGEGPCKFRKLKITKKDNQ